MTDLAEMDDAEFIKETVRALEESVRYFSSQNKPERERWVAVTFLENLNVESRPEDLVTPKDDPPDVAALGAQFEIKEILDLGRRRHEEYREELERARTAKNASELMTQFTPVDSSISEIFGMCGAAVSKLVDKYPPAVRSSLDLLFYVNLQHVFDVHEVPYPDTSTLTSAGWRSVSFVKGQIALCFCASPEAPEWLRQRVGQVSRKGW